MTRTAILIDDERLARLELRRLLSAHASIAIVGEASNIIEAQAAISEHRPHLLFLDVEMPGGSGFDLLAQLDTAPEVIFTTAYDGYALKAFEVSALDYLLKPIAAQRLAQALAKLEPATDTVPEHIFVKEGERCWFLKPEDLTLLESEGNYTRLHFPQAGGRRPLLLRSLQSLEERLPKEIFFRSNRKQLINLRQVEGVEVTVGEQLLVTLLGGMQSELSRRQSAVFRGRLSL